MVAGFFGFMGVAAALVFYGRFYLQWIVSEIKKQSVIPVAFWYMSTAGSLMLFVYGVYRQSPIGTLSHCFNIVIYARNLIHIWREKGTLSTRRSVLVHGAVGLVILTAMAFLALTWLREYGETKTASPEEFRQTWIWLAVGVLGQGLFGVRFIMQWLVTEARRKSVIPLAFWYISIVAALLLMASHLQRHEWIYAIGLGSTVLVYLRNLWLIHTHKAPPVADGEG